MNLKIRKQNRLLGGGCSVGCQKTQLVHPSQFTVEEVEQFQGHQEPEQACTNVNNVKGQNLENLPVPYSDEETGENDFQSVIDLITPRLKKKLFGGKDASVSQVEVLLKSAREFKQKKQYIEAGVLYRNCINMLTVQMDRANKQKKEYHILAQQLIEVLNDAKSYYQEINKHEEAKKIELKLDEMIVENMSSGIRATTSIHNLLLKRLIQNQDNKTDKQGKNIIDEKIEEQDAQEEETQKHNNMTNQIQNSFISSSENNSSTSQQQYQNSRVNSVARNYPEQKTGQISHEITPEINQSFQEMDLVDMSSQITNNSNQQSFHQNENVSIQKEMSHESFDQGKQKEQPSQEKRLSKQTSQDQVSIMKVESEDLKKQSQQLENPNFSQEKQKLELLNEVQQPQSQQPQSQVDKDQKAIEYM